jgi:UDP-N-acetylmuramyl pentapeptide phosphotransferase/UDP-N-acetylglucosamine-1-phosphate transferase
MQSPLLIIALAFTLSAFITRRLSRPGSTLSSVDLPNERSLHVHPTPRGGGIAIFSAVYLCLLLAYPFSATHISPEIVWLVSGGLIVGTVSYLDDLNGLPVLVRLAAHIAAAAMLIFSGFCPDCGSAPADKWLLLPIVIRITVMGYIVWLINLYNFMDGMDGFAGGMAVFGFSFLAYFGWIKGAESFLIISSLLAASSLGFLLFNFPPARIFMGDVGSAPLGFMVAGLSLWGVRDHLFPFWIPVLIFSPFIADATATLVRRILRGEKIWQAHCSHYYQRLVRLGWGHKKTVLAEYVLMTAAGLSAVLLEHLRGDILLVAGLTGWVLIYIFLALITNELEKGSV